MSKEIVEHHDGFGLYETMKVEAIGELGPGGARHVYRISIPGGSDVDIRFQRGPRDEEGSQTGILDATLIAVVLDRMRDFQGGPFACRENALVITKLEEALMWMRERARRRALRGVLGKNKA